LLYTWFKVITNVHCSDVASSVKMQLLVAIFLAITSYNRERSRRCCLSFLLFVFFRRRKKRNRPYFQRYPKSRLYQRWCRAPAKPAQPFAHNTGVLCDRQTDRRTITHTALRRVVKTGRVTEKTQFHSIESTLHTCPANCKLAALTFIHYTRLYSKLTSCTTV